MTKKRYKVWDKNNWGEVTWVDTRMEQLLYNVNQLNQNNRMMHYAVHSPTPLWMLKEGEQPTMTTVTRHRFSKEIAEVLIATHGAFAHFYCLEKIENHHGAGMWRDVLTWIDELTGEEDASS